MSTKLFLRLQAHQGRQAGERWGMHYPNDPHQGSTECKRSLVPGTEEEDAAWCEVCRKKWPFLAPGWLAWVCTAVPHAGPYREDKLRDDLDPWDILQATGLKESRWSAWIPERFQPSWSSYQKPRDLLSINWKKDLKSQIKGLSFKIAILPDIWLMNSFTWPC